MSIETGHQQVKTNSYSDRKKYTNLNLISSLIIKKIFFLEQKKPKSSRTAWSFYTSAQLTYTVRC